jgi:nucleotide-binding universal stress UspA family protein
LQIKKILVPFDDSKFSDKSLKYAVELAKVVFLGSSSKQVIRILLVHVIQEIPITKSLFDIPTTSKASKKTSLSQHTTAIYDEMKNSIEKTVIEKINKFESTEGVKIDLDILYGNPANEIVDYATKNKVDLLVIGSNGLQGLAKIKGLGSVSRKVSERISCPITIIR